MLFGCKPAINKIKQACWFIASSAMVQVALHATGTASLHHSLSLGESGLFTF